MSNVCSSCGSTGGLSQTCATKLSQIVWDGGSMCNGYSGTSVIDAILSLSQSICNLNTEFTSFAVTSDDVTYTTTSADLTTTLDGMATDISTLQTDIASLDGTLVLHYDKTTVNYNSAGTTTFGTLKTLTLPANTFNADDEYLVVEGFVYIPIDDTSDAKLRITLDGQPILLYYLNNANNVKMPTIAVRFFAIPVRKGTGITLGDYHGYAYKNLQSYLPFYGELTPTAGLNFANALTLVVEGYNITGNISCNMFRVTKYRSKIIY